MLIRRACSCWRSRGAAAGGHCRIPGPRRPRRRRAPPLSSRPPACEAPGRDRQTGGYWFARCPPLSRALRIRSTVEMEASLSFFPGSSKTAAAGDAAGCGHSLEETDGEMDRQAEDGGQREGNIEGQRWSHGNGLPTEQRGRNPRLSPCLFPISPSTQGCRGGSSLQTADLLWKDENHSRSLRQISSSLPEPGRREGKLDCWEIFQGERWPDPSFRGQPRTQRRRVPEVHYPVTLCLSLRAGSLVISPVAF